MSQNNSPPKKSPAPLILLSAGVLLLLVSVVWGFQLGSTATDSAAQPIQNTNLDDVPNPEIQRVSLADSRVAFDQGQAVFLDVRNSSDFAKSHIPGAVLIPLSELDQRLVELDPSQWIITYCT
jgi:3-mercaptopyruvate sulfurtransferase SseA